MQDYIWEIHGNIYALVQGAEDAETAKERIAAYMEEPTEGYIHECNVPANVDPDFVRFQDIVTTDSIHVSDI